MNLHYETIKKFFPLLIDKYVIESEVNSLVYKSYSKSLLTHDDLAEIEGMTSPGRKMSEFCRILLEPKRMLNYEVMYNVLIEEFVDKGREPIAQELQKLLQETSKLFHSKEKAVDDYYEAVRDMFHYLIENYSIECQISSLAIAMVSNEFIDVHDLETINKTTLNEEKMSRLLQKLLRRAGLINYKDVYNVLVDEISKDRRDVADELNVTLDTIKKKNNMETNGKLYSCSDMHTETLTKHSQNFILKPDSGASYIADSYSVPLSANVEEMKENSEEKSHSELFDITGVSEENPKSGTSTLHASPGNTSATMAKELIDACRCNNVDEVNRLLDEGADVNAVEDDWPALMYSCKLGYAAIVELLLKHSDINVNATSEDGSTPLFYACHYKKRDVVKLLLNHKDIDINLAADKGITPLMEAVRSPDVASVLLNHPKIDVNCKNKYGCTALHYACHYNEHDVIKLLLNHKDIDINLATDKGITPLMEAVRSPDVASMLLNRPEIDVNCKNKNGWTALMEACRLQEATVVNLLLAHPGIDVNITDITLETPLMLAVSAGSYLIVDLLLKHPKIDVSKVNKKNMTARYIAKKAGRADIVALLRSHKKGISLRRNFWYNLRHM